MKRILLIAAAIVFIASTAFAQKEVEIQREATGVYDLQKNSVSNVEFYTTNYGVFGFDVTKGKAGGFWPRGSQNNYIFAGGFWFAAKKEHQGEMKKYVTVSYNPNNGRSWFVPGRVEDGNKATEDEKKYRCYFSTDFDQETGQVKNENDGPNWPYWVTDSQLKYEYGVFKHEYIYDESDRNLDTYPEGPLFVSDEDIVSTMKDTDLDRYDGGAAYREGLGYPLGLQVDTKTYTWSEGDQHDVVIQMYVVENVSNDILYDCWFTGIYDTDIGYQPDGYQAAMNDHTRYFDEDPSLNLVVSWTGTDKGEAGRGFGYLGCSLLESPAVDAEGFIRSDKLLYEIHEQLGLVTCRNWIIENDINSDEARYNFMSSGIKDGDNGAGDKRVNVGTGPFNMRPGDKARIVIAYSFAMPAKGGEADGTYEDLTGFTQEVGKGGSQILAKNGSLIAKLENAAKSYYKELIASVDQMPELTLDIQRVYPNPASNHITIDFSNRFPGYAELAIYDLSGKKVMSLMSGPIEAKRHITEYSLDTKLESGAYLIKLKIGEESVTSKLMITK
jgi:hypothetical protein